MGWGDFGVRAAGRRGSALPPRAYPAHCVRAPFVGDERGRWARAAPLDSCLRGSGEEGGGEWGCEGVGDVGGLDNIFVTTGLDRAFCCVTAGEGC